MNTKEKAKELFTKFSSNTVHYDAAKQGALIAVDEILKILYSLKLGNAISEELEFFEEVKQEIELLFPNHVGFEDLEQNVEFEKEMSNDIDLLFKNSKRRLENQNKLLLQLEKNESMADFAIATETVRAILTDI